MRTAIALRASNQISTIRTIRFFFYHHFLRAELRRARRTDEIHLADQGFLQHLRRIHLTAQAEGMEYLYTLAETAYPPLVPNLVVFVDVDHRTRMERAVGRGTSVDEELFDPTHPAIQDDRESYADMRAFVSVLRDDYNPDLQVLVIDNRDDNLNENIETLVSAITETYERSETDRQTDGPMTPDRAMQRHA